MQLANKMFNRMEDAIDAVKWFQYNHQIFQDKPRYVKQMLEGESWEVPHYNVYATAFTDRGLWLPINPKVISQSGNRANHNEKDTDILVL